MYSIVYNYDLTVCVYGIEVYDEYNEIPFIKNWTGYNHNSLLVTTLCVDTNLCIPPNF